MKKIANRTGMMFAYVEWIIYYHMGMRFILKEDINYDALWKAVQSLFCQFPFFCSRLKFASGQCYIVNNNKKFRIHKSKKFIRPCSFKNNYYPIAITCTDKIITITFSHTLTDGSVMIKASDFLINQYLAIVNNKTFVKPQYDLKPLDYTDIDFSKFPIDNNNLNNKNKNANSIANNQLNNASNDTNSILKLNNDNFLKNKKHDVVIFNIDAESFHTAVKQNNTHHTGLFIYLINKTFSCFKQGNKNIVADLLVNCRKYLDIEDSYLNCIFEVMVSSNLDNLNNNSKEKIIDDINSQLKHGLSKNNITRLANNKKHSKSAGEYTYFLNNFGNLDNEWSAKNVYKHAVIDYVVNKFTCYSVNNQLFLLYSLSKEDSTSFKDNFKKVLKNEDIVVNDVLQLKPIKEKGVKNSLSMFINTLILVAKKNKLYN